MIVRALNERQKEYCNGRALGMTQLAAYIAAGYNKNAGAKDSAFKLEKQPKIKAEIKRLQSLKDTDKELGFLWSREKSTQIATSKLELIQSQLDEQFQTPRGMSSMLLQSLWQGLRLLNEMYGITEKNADILSAPIVYIVEDLEPDND